MAIMLTQIESSTYDPSIHVLVCWFVSNAYLCNGPMVILCDSESRSRSKRSTAGSQESEGSMDA